MAEPLNVKQQKPLQTPILHAPPAVVRHHQPGVHHQPRPLAHHSVGIHQDQVAPILRSSSSVNPDGGYEYSFETGNGISAQESGVGGHSAEGSARWVAPDGTPIELHYTADGNGFHPDGEHLPTPPPIPEYILRSLAYIEAHPPPKEELLRYNNLQPSPVSKPTLFAVPQQQLVGLRQQPNPVYKPFSFNAHNKQYKKY